MGLAVARGCAVENPLYITDQLEMHSLMEHNISLNRLEGKAKAAILNWSVRSSSSLSLSLFTPAEQWVS